MADICCSYALMLAERVGLDKGIPDSLKTYCERLMQRDAFPRAWAREDAGPPAL